MTRTQSACTAAPSRSPSSSRARSPVGGRRRWSARRSCTCTATSATSDTECDTAALERLGLELEVLDSGCCGLAGSFGYEAGEPYDVSIKAGEQVLLPAVRSAPPETLVVTDGFSCRSQIEHGARRRAYHLAEAIRLALPDARPPMNRSGNHRVARTAAAATLAGGGVAVALRRRRR
jgi:hypothetical protein